MFFNIFSFCLKRYSETVSIKIYCSRYHTEKSCRWLYQRTGSSFREPKAFLSRFFYIFVFLFAFLHIRLFVCFFTYLSFCLLLTEIAPFSKQKQKISHVHFSLSKSFSNSLLICVIKLH